MKLTRYLYNHTEVKQCLLLSILRHNSNDTLFWLCELFYSGLEDEIFELLNNIYTKMYIHYEFLKDYVKIFKKKIKSKIITTRLCAYASFAVTMCFQNYNLVTFVKEYFKMDCIQETNRSDEFENKIITIDKEKLQEYKDITKEKHCYNILKKGCKLPIVNEYNILFNTKTKEDYSVTLENIRLHWLYYCIETPVWKNRIMEYNGTYDPNNKEVTFEDEDKLQEFHTKYGYEPDEQPLDIIEKLIGKEHIEYKTLTDFCQEFHLKEHVQNSIKLYSKDNIEKKYFVVKALELLKDWFNTTSNKNNFTEITPDNKLILARCSQMYSNFPITKIKKTISWNVDWDVMDNLLYIQWQSQFNGIDKKTAKQLKDLENPLAFIDLVIIKENKILFGIDVVCNNETISKEKINSLKKNGLTNYYKIHAEWVLNNTKRPDSIIVEKIL